MHTKIVAAQNILGTRTEQPVGGNTLAGRMDPLWDRLERILENRLLKGRVEIPESGLILNFWFEPHMCPDSFEHTSTTYTLIQFQTYFPARETTPGHLFDALYFFASREMGIDRPFNGLPNGRLAFLLPPHTAIRAEFIAADDPNKFHFLLRQLDSEDNQSGATYLDLHGIMKIASARAMDQEHLHHALGILSEMFKVKSEEFV